MNFKTENKINRIKHYAYQSEDLIGRGAAGKVYKGLNEQNGEQVAIKIMEMDKIDNEVTEYLLACEKDALMSIDNPYVLHAYEIVQTELQCLIITPLCNGGTLKQHIVAKGKLPQSEALHIFVKLLRGYLAIRNKGFIHRDIKSSNVMFRDGDPVIIDFGYCEKTGGKKPKMFYNVGSPSYMSPEAYMKTFYSEKSDLWSLGIVLYEMLEGFTIDHGQPIDRYFSSLLRNGPSFRSKITEATKQMLKTVLNPNYHDRPHVQFIIQNVQRIIFYGNQPQPQKQPSQTPAAPKKSHTSQPNIPSAPTPAKISLKQSQKKATNQILSEKLIESRYKYEQVEQHQRTPQREKEKEADMGRLMEEKLKGSPMRLLMQGQARTELNGVGFKLSQSVYRQEVRANGKVIVNQPQKINASFISKEMAQNMPQTMTSQPVFQTQHQQRPPSQQFFIARSPQEQAFIAAQNQGRFMPARIPQPSPKLQPRLEKLTPEYRSMMAPSSQPQQPTKPTLLQNNTKNPNVFHSKLFNAQSFLSVEDREAIGSRQLFANIKMIDSISNQKTTASGNGLFGRQGNPVVQSLIVEPHYQQQQQGRPAFRDNQPVYQSVIINQPASSFSSQQLHFMERQSYQPPQVQFQQHAYPQQMQFPIRTSFHQQPNKPRPQFLPPQLNFPQFQQFPQFQHAPQPQPQPNRNTAPVSNPRPFSPIANEGKQMFINQSARENNRVVFENASKNFIKKTEPYFHMNNNMNANTNMNMNGNQKVMPQFHHEFQARQTMQTFQPRTAPTPHRMPQGLHMPPQAMFRR